MRVKCTVDTLQEIYSNTDTQDEYHPNDQLHFLLSRLPSQYQYHHFSPNSNSNDWSGLNDTNQEGLAIISKYPITDVVPYFFKERSSNPDSGDMNPRMMLKVTLSITADSFIDVYLTHLTYDKSLQCQHVKEMREQMLRLSKSNKDIKSIMVTGDLNAYHDFVYPMELLQFGKTNGNRQCTHHWAVELGSEFIDVFENLIGDELDRLTFSNMPWPGMVSRPDRLYFSNIHVEEDHDPFLKMESAEIIGDGVEYRRLFYFRILWYRLEMAWNGEQCPFDCGPNGYCQCGNCVKNPNGITDEMEDCKDSECAQCADYLQSAILWTVLIVVIHLVAYCGCIRGLYVRPRMKVFEGAAWSVPTVTVFGFSSLFFIVLTLLYCISDTVIAVIDLMDEELFPSDHRGLVSTFSF